MYIRIICVYINVMCIMLTVPSVVNFTTGLAVFSEVPVHSSLWTTLAAAFCSTAVGGDCSGRARTCPTVSLDGDSCVTFFLHSDLMCSPKCFSSTTAEHLSQLMRSVSSTLIVTTEAGLNELVPHCSPDILQSTGMNLGFFY